VTGAEAIRFLVEEAAIYTARFPAVHVQISQYNRIVVENDLKMLVNDSLAIYLKFIKLFTCSVLAAKY
jgi:hypothetical protein